MSDTKKTLNFAAIMGVAGALAAMSDLRPSNKMRHRNTHNRKTSDGNKKRKRNKKNKQAKQSRKNNR